VLEEVEEVEEEEVDRCLPLPEGPEEVEGEQEITKPNLLGLHPVIS